jgi:hypothetical protein
MLSRYILICLLTVSIMAPLVWAASKSPFVPQQPPSENSTSHHDKGHTVSTNRPKMQFTSPSVRAASLNETETVEVPDIPKVKSDPHDAGPDDTTGSLSMRPQVNKPPPPADARPSKLGRKVGLPTTTPEMLPMGVLADTSASVNAPAGDHASLVHRHKHDYPELDRLPLVRDIYAGVHVIIICSTLTKAQKHQVGCP